MEIEIDRKILKNLYYLSSVTAAIAVTFSSIVMVGWIANIKSLTSLYSTVIPTDPATALFCIVAGLILLLLLDKEFSLDEKKVILPYQIVLALFVVLGLARIGGYIFHINLLFEQYLTTGGSDKMVHMAPNSAASIVLLSLGILFSVEKKENTILIGQILNLSAVTISILAVMGYIFGISSLYEVGESVPMGIYSAILISLVSSAAMFLRPDKGFMAVINSDGVGGVMARNLMPVAILIPLVLGYLRSQGEQLDLFSADFGISLFVVLIMLNFSFLIWGNAKSLNQADVLRKDAEKQLMAAKLYAEEAKNTQEQFLANMSHEIRTPMNGVIGMTNLLAGTPLNSEQNEYVGTIKESADNLLVIINDILDLTKIKMGKVELEHIEFSLPDVIKRLTNIIRYKAEEKHIELNYDISPDVPSALIGDPVRLNQVLLNLVGNAIKFTEKGAVNIRIERIGPDPSPNKIALHFKVMDSGIGIEEHKLDQVFESFTQASSDTTRKFGGTGLGLTISKQLIEMQGGTIGVRSSIGKGTTFYFNLNFDKGDSSRLDKKVASAKEIEAHNMHGVKILLVEDNKINQRVAELTIKKWGVNIEIADNGRIGLEMIGSKPYDLVLMDVQMPEMDGLEATRRVRSTLPEPARSIPIVAMTASALKDETNKCIVAGMNDYITKPFDVDDLFNIILPFVKHKIIEAPLITAKEEVIVEAVKEPVVFSEPQYIDLTYLKSIDEGNTVFVKEMIDSFLDNTPKSLDLIRQYLAAEDWENLYQISHKIKPSFKFMGIHKLEECIMNLEQSARKKENLEEIPIFIDQIEEISAKAFAELKLESQAIS